MINKIKGFFMDGHQSTYKKVAAFFTQAGIVLGMAAQGVFWAGYEINTDGIADQFKATFNDVYFAIIGSATAIAVAIIACCLVNIMTTKNMRKIEEMQTWIKSVCIAWVCLMCVSLIINFIKALVGDAINGHSNEILFPDDVK